MINMKFMNIDKSFIWPSENLGKYIYMSYIYQLLYMYAVQVSSLSYSSLKNNFYNPETFFNFFFNKQLSTCITNK